MPLFNTVYAQVKEANPSIPDGVQLYISEDEFPNAFATGRKTICVTRGFLTKSPEEIKAVLAHEFGHLAHKDTDIILFVSVGNLIVMFAVAMFRAVFFALYKLTHWSYSNSNNVNGYKMADNTTHLYKFFTAIIAAIMWVWTKIGVFLVMKSSRDNEFEADQFAYQLGYGPALCSVLTSISSNGAKGLFASLMSSHPDSAVRIERLKSL